MRKKRQELAGLAGFDVIGAPLSVAFVNVFLSHRREWLQL